MTQPIRQPLPFSKPIDTAALAKRMQVKVTTLAEELEKAVVDPSVSTQELFLKNFENTVNDVKSIIEQCNQIRD